MNRVLKRAAARAQVVANRLLVQSWRAHRAMEENHLSRLLDELRVDCIFDVGANVGGYMRMLRDYCGYRGLILSFEPSPSTFQGLQKCAAGDNRWKGFNVGLGAARGRALLHENPGESEGNSFLPWKNDFQRPNKQIEVEIATISDLFPELQREFGFRRPFLKMDTQGFDLEVFAGARGYYEAFAGLQSELALVPYYEGAPEWNTALKRYQEAGFVLSALVPNNAISYPELREIDCVMFRPSFYEKRG